MKGVELTGNSYYLSKTIGTLLRHASNWRKIAHKQTHTHIQATNENIIEIPKLCIRTPVVKYGPQITQDLGRMGLATVLVFGPEPCYPVWLPLLRISPEHL